MKWYYSLMMVYGFEASVSRCIFNQNLNYVSGYRNFRFKRRILLEFFPFPRTTLHDSDFLNSFFWKLWVEIFHLKQVRNWSDSSISNTYISFLILREMNDFQTLVPCPSASNFYVYFLVEWSFFDSKYVQRW